MNTRALIKLFAASVFTKVLGAASSFVMMVVAGRALGVDQSGLFFLGLSFVTLVSVFSRIGLDSTVVRFVGESHAHNEFHRMRQATRKAVFLAGGASLLTATTVFFGSQTIATIFFGKPEMGSVLREIAPSIVGLSLLTLFAMALQGIGRIGYSILVLSIMANFLLVAGLPLLQIEEATRAARVLSISTVITSLVGLLVFWWFSRGGGDSKDISWIAVFQSCLPLWLVSVALQLTQWAGQLSAGMWVSPEEIALLAVAQRTSNLVGFVFVGVNLVVAPKFAAMYSKGDLAGIEHLSLVSVRFLAAVALPISIAMFVAPRLCLSIFGSEFVHGPHLLQILIVGQFISVICGSVFNLLSMTGHEKDLRNISIAAGVIAIVSAVVLTYQFSAIGAAISTSLAMTIHSLLAVWAVKRRLGFNTLAFRSPA